MDTGTEEKSQIDEILGKLQKRIAAALGRTWRDEAEDRAQDAIVVVLSKYRHIHDEGDLVRLLFGIKRRIEMSLHSRGTKPEQPPPLTGPEGFLDDRPTPEDAISKREQISMLQTAIGKLRDRCRDLMRLRLQGAETTEIAARFDVTTNNLYVMEKRCLERLRKLMPSFPAGKGDAHAR